MLGDVVFWVIGSAVGILGMVAVVASTATAIIGGRY